jgi:hypothetical protein
VLKGLSLWVLVGSIGSHITEELCCFLSQLNLWRYGDFRADDADEFGYSR